MMTSSMQCERDENTMMSCLHHPHALRTIMMWCSYNANTNDVMAPHSYVVRMERVGDVIVTWFASYANLLMSRWACASCAHMHGTHAIIKISTSKYSNGLMGTPADSNLGKITASHFKALITQNANENMPDMFPIVYLNENLRYCNEN